MKTFLSLKEPLKHALMTIVASTELHSKWLNTLSYMENCGARKLAACEHPVLVKEEMLKHAAEEFRHAHHLKRQIEKISTPLVDYSLPFLLGGVSSLQYLQKLNIKISRYLKVKGFSQNAIIETAYLLVTFAIELRAHELYDIYDDVLKKMKSKVRVKSILLEEKEHLQEMVESLEKIPNGSTYAEVACVIEGELCKKWLLAILLDTQTQA